MSQNKKQNISYTYNNLYGYEMCNFFSDKWIQMDSSTNLNKYTSNSSKRCVFEVDLVYPEE